MMNPDDVPDKTYSELLEDDEFDVDEELADTEQLHEEIADLREFFELMSTAVTLSLMFEDDHITLREYIKLTNWIDERERELDHTLL